jgi:hypothetical protein
VPNVFLYLRVVVSSGVRDCHEAETEWEGWDVVGTPDCAAAQEERLRMIMMRRSGNWRIRILFDLFKMKGSAKHTWV